MEVKCEDMWMSKSNNGGEKIFVMGGAFQMEKLQMKAMKRSPDKETNKN